MVDTPVAGLRPHESRSRPPPASVACSALAQPRPAPRTRAVRRRGRRHRGRLHPQDDHQNVVHRRCRGSADQEVSRRPTHRTVAVSPVEQPSALAEEGGSVDEHAAGLLARVGVRPVPPAPGPSIRHPPARPPTPRPAAGRDTESVPGWGTRPPAALVELVRCRQGRACGERGSRGGSRPRCNPPSPGRQLCRGPTPGRGGAPAQAWGSHPHPPPECRTA